MKKSALLALALASVPSLRAAPGDVTAVVRDRLAAEVLRAPPPSGRKVAELLASQAPDGSWADIPYGNRDRSLWPPAGHLHRLLQLELALRRPGIDPAPAAAIRAAVRSGLAFWVARDPRSANWWWNTIGMQQALAPVLVLAREDLRAEAPAVWRGACAQLARSHVDRMTGANLVWEATNLLELGALTGDRALVARMAGLIAGEIRVTTAEGVQPDFSFHQHGPQLNAGNYGLSFVPSAARVALLLRGTALRFPPPKLAILSAFESGFQEWVVWGRYLDLSSCGRQLDLPGAQMGKARSIAAAGLLLGQLEPSQAPHWRTFWARVAGRLPPGTDAPRGDRYYWRSDFLVHRPGSWYLSVKMFSPRVLRTETWVNHENYRGYHLCDGMMQLLVRGDEYRDIQPVWDWRKLPGVTFKATAAPLPYGQIRGTEHNPCPFVGGVVDDGPDGRAYAVAAMDLVKEDVGAQKAWFCFPEGVVCLGTAIRCGSPQAVATDINQCLLRGPVAVLAADGRWMRWPEGTGPKSLGAGVRAVLHDRVGYVSLAPADWVLSAGPQTGSWALLRKEGVSSAPVTRQVFNLWIDHGVRPREGSYAYAVLPLTDRDGLAAFARHPYLQVVANGSSQIVAAPGVIEAVFHRPGRCPAAGGLPGFSVDRPCVVIERRREGRVGFAVADPTQTLREVVLAPAGGVPRTVALPSGGLAGSAAELWR
jgi:chondroitin AC lyase